MKNSVKFFLPALALFAACSGEKNPGWDISTDQEQITAGKSLFEQNCAACHNFTQNAIGPNLSGVTHEMTSEWVKNFIKNPTQIIESGDERAKATFAAYKTYMPAFPNLGDEQMDQILSYLHTYEKKAVEQSADKIEDPIPDSVADSGIRMELEFFFQVPPTDTITPLAKITKLESEPVSGRTFLQDQHGVMYEIINGKPVEYLNLKKLRPEMVSKPGLATGFGSWAFHPDFVNNGILYTSHTVPGGTAPADFAYADSIPVKMQWVLTEWKTNNPKGTPYVGEGREFFRIDVPTQIHGVQELAFNPKSKPGDEDYGLLYVGVGDGGSAENGFAFIPDHQGRLPWSSILRIDPSGRNSKNGKYGIPASNPFASDPNKAGEVYAYGFRNPNRVFWSPDGQLLASEIGHHNIEELNKIEPGKFYGWPQREGTFLINPYGNMSDLFPLPADDAELGSTYPLIQLDHDELNAIIAGYFIPSGELEGNFLFGDVPGGKLYISDLKGDQPKVESWKVIYNGKEMTIKELCDCKRVDLKFGQDKTGQLYLMTKFDGKVYKIKTP